jgi:hypothetical protein
VELQGFVDMGFWRFDPSWSWGLNYLKNRENLLRNYAPVLCLLLLMVFVFIYNTLPSLKMNRYLNRVRAKRIEEIKAIKAAEERFIHLKEALIRDPITIENHLKRRFGGAKRAGEVEIDLSTR